MDKTDELILLAVCEYDDYANDVQQRRKIRIRHHDTTNGVCSAHDLRARVCQAVQHDDAVATTQIWVRYQGRQVELTDSVHDMARQFGRTIHLEVAVPAKGLTSPHSMLTIEGRMYPFSSPYTVLDKYELVIEEDINNFSLGTGANVWDGAVLLARYLEWRTDLIRGQNVLELGSGTGFVGIVASALGARTTTLSDLPYMMPLMQRNIARNKTTIDNISSNNTATLHCQILDWCNPIATIVLLPHVDVILVADCVWLCELVTPLLNTLQALLDRFPHVRVVLAYQQRGRRTHEAFMRGLSTLFTVRERVNVTHEAGLPQPPDKLQLWSCRRS